MEKTVIGTNDLTEEMVSQMFIDYVSSMEDKERHTEAACIEVDNFDQYCEERFPKDIRLQTELFDKMMNVAVEYEESGFIAGVKWMLKLLKEQEKISTVSE